MPDHIADREEGVLTPQSGREDKSCPATRRDTAKSRMTEYLRCDMMTDQEEKMLKYRR